MVLTSNVTYLADLLILCSMRVISNAIGTNNWL